MNVKSLIHYRQLARLACVAASTQVSGSPPAPSLTAAKGGVSMNRKIMAFAILMLSGVVARAGLAQTSATWAGGAGNWAPCPPEGNALWNTCGFSPPVTPGGNYDVLIQGGPVTQNYGTSVVNLNITAGNTLLITPGYLYVTGASITNDGSILIGPGDGLVMDGTTTTLSGKGTVTITDPNASLGGAAGVDPTLILQQPVSGQGSLGVYFNLTNESTIKATSGTLTIEPISVINTGKMEATSGNTLQVVFGSAAPFNNTGGTIEALAGGSVMLLDGVYTGGTLKTVETGTIKADNGAFLNNLTNAGTLQIGNASLEGTINNTGTIQVASGTLYMNGNVTLSGKGSLLLGSTGQLQQLSGTDTLTSEQLIHGSGKIYALPLTNQGTIAADSEGNTLTISDATTTNTGAIEAKGGGLLTLGSGSLVNNAGGTVKALAGSTVTLEGTVAGGTLSTSGSGTIQAENCTLDGTTNTVTNAGTLDANNYSVSLEGTIKNTGAIVISGSGWVEITQPATLTGTGKLTMGADTFFSGSGASFTNESTIQGAGRIGNYSMALENNGTILANQTSPLVIAPGMSGFTNDGTLTVNAGSTLTINGPFTNVSSNGTLARGTYTVSGVLGLPQSISANSAKTALSGTAWQILNTTESVNALAAISSNTASGDLTVENGAVLTTTKSFKNSGKLKVAAGSSFSAASYVQTEGSATVDGTLTASSVIKLESGTVLGTGMLSGAVSSGAAVTVGDSSTQPGKLAITGSYAQSASGALNVSVGGTAAGMQYSQLVISGAANLGGTLNITLADGFVPAIGDTFTILMAGSATGQFTAVNGTVIDSNEHFEVSYSGSAVVLQAAAGT